MTDNKQNAGDPMALVDSMLERTTKQLAEMKGDGPMLTGLRLGCVWVNYYRAQVRNEIHLAAVELGRIDAGEWDGDTFEPTPSPFTKGEGER